MKKSSPKSENKNLKKNSFLKMLNENSVSFNSKTNQKDTDKFIRSLRESKR